MATSVKLWALHIRTVQLGVLAVASANIYNIINNHITSSRLCFLEPKM